EGDVHNAGEDGRGRGGGAPRCTGGLRTPRWADARPHHRACPSRITPRVPVQGPVINHGTPRNMAP
ncbi:Protein of unknown function, partial [Gryllus bimaculatus]